MTSKEKAQEAYAHAYRAALSAAERFQAKRVDTFDKGPVTSLGSDFFEAIRERNSADVALMKASKNLAEAL